MTTNDLTRQKVIVEDIDELYAPPGIVRLEPEKDSRKFNRVSMAEDELKARILELFEKKQHWKAEEIANYLDHPPAPIKAVLKLIADYDPATKHYAEKEHFHHH